MLIAVLFALLGFLQLWNERTTRLESAIRAASRPTAPFGSARPTQSPQAPRAARAALPSPGVTHHPISPSPSTSTAPALRAQIDQLQSALASPRRSEQLAQEISNAQFQLQQLEHEQQAAQSGVTTGALEDTRDAQENKIALEDQARAAEVAAQSDRALVAQINDELKNTNLQWYPDRIVALQDQRTAAILEINRLDQQSRDLRIQAGVAASQVLQQQVAAERQRTQTIRDQFDAQRTAQTRHLEELKAQLAAAQKQEANQQTQLETLQEQYREALNAS